jgi:hypothetical protein
LFSQTLINLFFFHLSSQTLVNGIVTNQASMDQWKKRDVTCRNYIMATNEPSQKKNIYGLASGREMLLNIETQYDPHIGSYKPRSSSRSQLSEKLI